MIKNQTRSIAPQFGNRVKTKKELANKSQSEPSRDPKFWYPRDLDIPDGGSLVKPRQIQPEVSKNIPVTIRKKRDCRD